MQPIGPSLPEFDARWFQTKATPIWRQWHSFARIFLLEFNQFLLQSSAIRNRFALM
jgi:hypothetical protein